MRTPWWLVASLLALPAMAAGQAQGTLRITVALPDAGGAPTPVPGHVLLISDNPATSEPRRLRTAADGSVSVRLRPGSYTVESDRPVAFQGKGYQWTEMLDVLPGREAALALTAANAEVVPLTAGSSSAGPAAAAPTDDPVFLRGKWESGVVAVWSPTARATGFLADARGLILTDATAVGAATEVEVQFSATLKVPGRVIRGGGATGGAVVWVDPSVLAGRAPLPLTCPPAPSRGLDVGQEVVTLAMPLRTGLDILSGEVTGQRPRAVDVDFRLGFGGTGGPVFDASGALVGLTSAVPESGNTGRAGDVGVVRAGVLCETLTASAAALANAAPPAPTPLPVDPPAADAPAAVAEAVAAVPVGLTSTDFDIALITPAAIARARERAGRTGGAPTRAQDVEARLGPITEFDAWEPYFLDGPPVLIVRATPKMVEGFWKRLGREALRTQGAALPPLKDFKGSFLRLRASCGNDEVRPIHPFVLEHALPRGDRQVVREGLYVFALDAFASCADARLQLYSEKAPQKADEVALPADVLARLRPRP